MGAPRQGRSRPEARRVRAQSQHRRSAAVRRFAVPQHTRVLARHRLADHDYRLSQLRYDLAKLRAKGLVERLGRTRRYRLTPIGLKLGVLLVKLRTRLLGPLATLVTNLSPHPTPLHHDSVDAAFAELDTALDHLSAALGLQYVA